MTRYGPTGAILMIDIDGFKAVNDAVGHHGGDQAILAVGHLLCHSVRRSDLVARLGGDEFAVLLARGELPDAQVVAERIVRGARTLTIPTGDLPAPLAGLSVSVGIAAITTAHTTTPTGMRDVLRNADRALYAAKAAGRDQHAVHDPPEPG